jgi:hypothetical protein
MEVKRARSAGFLIAGINVLLLLYMVGWAAGVTDLRRLTDWRGPVAAFVLAIALSSVILIQHIQAIE